MDNGENNQREEKKGVIDRANDLIDTGRKLKRRADQIQKAVRTIRTASTVIRSGAALLNPWVLGAIVVIIIILLVIIMLSGDESRPDYNDYYGAEPSPVPVTDPGTTPTTPIPGLSLSLAQPSPTTVGQPIRLVITVENDQSQDIDVLAPIPPGYELVSVERGTYDNRGSLIIWNLRRNQPDNPNDIIERYTFIFVIRALEGASDIDNYTISARYATAQNSF